MRVLPLPRSSSCHGEHEAPASSRRAQPQAGAAPHQRERGGGRRRRSHFVGRRRAAPPGVPRQARRGAQVGRGRHRARLRTTLVRPGERPDSAPTQWQRAQHGAVGRVQGPPARRPLRRAGRQADKGTRTQVQHLIQLTAEHAQQRCLHVLVGAMPSNEKQQS